MQQAQQQTPSYHAAFVPPRLVVTSAPSSTQAPTLATAQPDATLLAATATLAARPLPGVHHKRTTECTVDSSCILPATVNMQETPCPTSVPPTGVICPASSESGFIGASANAQSGTERNVISLAQENPPVFPYVGSPLSNIHYLDSHEVDPTLEEEFRSADLDDEEALGVSQEVSANYQVASLLVKPLETIVVVKSKDAYATWKVAGPDYDPPSTIEERHEAILRRANGELPCLGGGIHERDGGVDLLALWLRLYVGNIDDT